MALILPSREWLDMFTADEISPLIDFGMVVADEALKQDHQEFYDEVSLWLDMAIDLVCRKIDDE